MDLSQLSQVTPGAWLMIAIAALLLGCCFTAVSYRLAEAYTAVEDRIRARLRRQAADHGEPAREHVEAPWRSVSELDAVALPRRGRS